MKYNFTQLIVGSLLGLLSLLAFFSTSTTHANNDLLNKAFDEAKKYDYIINPGNDKEAVGGQVFNPTVDISLNDNFGKGCFIGGKEDSVDLRRRYCEEKLWFDWNVEISPGNGAGLGKGCFEKPADGGKYIKKNISQDDLRAYCENDLKWDYNITAIGIELKEPYYIRITKLILRVMIAISVSIIIFAGISYALAFGDPNKQKKAQDMVMYALLGVLLALGALAIIQLTLTLTKSTLSL